MSLTRPVIIHAAAFLDEKLSIASPFTFLHHADLSPCLLVQTPASSKACRESTGLVQVIENLCGRGFAFPIVSDILRREGRVRRDIPKLAEDQMLSLLKRCPHLLIFYSPPCSSQWPIKWPVYCDSPPRVPHVLSHHKMRSVLVRSGGK